MQINNIIGKWSSLHEQEVHQTMLIYLGVRLDDYSEGNINLNNNKIHLF